MKRTVPVAKHNIRTAYLTYLNTCGILQTKLSPDTHLQATYDNSKKRERLTFTAIDFKTKQLVNFTPEGTFHHYKLLEVA